MSQPAAYCYKSLGGVTCRSGKKLTQEQLSFVIELHRKDLLRRGGDNQYDPDEGPEEDFCETQVGCINQHLYRLPLVEDAFNTNAAVAAWFDHNYQRHWSDGELEFALRSANLVEPL